MPRRSSRPASVPFALSLAVALLVPAGGAAQAPDTSPPRVLLRQLYGDVAVELRTAPAGGIRLGAADGTRTIALTVLARDLRRWSDSAVRVLAARAPRRTRAGEWRATVEGPGLEAGAMSLTRTIAKKDTTISVFISNSQFEGVKFEVGAAEARAFVAAMRRAAAVVLAPPPARKPPATRPPARKPPEGAHPPAPGSAPPSTRRPLAPAPA